MKKLADGRTAELYARDEKYVIKLYRPGWEATDADYEFKLVQQIQGSSIPTPAAVELVTIDGRPGIVFERVNGRNLLEIIQEDPSRLEPLTKQLAALQAQLHGIRLNGLPDNQQRLQRKITNARPLSVEMKTAVLAQLNQLPQDNALLHGDFHPGNILLTDDGPVIIDWIDASLGHPLADVARTIIIIGYGDPAEADAETLARLQQIRQLFLSVYLETYGALRPFAPADLEAWQMPVAAGRLSENILEVEADLLTIVKNALTPRG